MTGADFLQLSPGAAPVRGLTGWLADAIRAAIMDGRLRAGTPLPATRLLAGDLGVSRGVIVEAYQRLADEGLVSARPGAGTRVLLDHELRRCGIAPDAVSGYAREEHTHLAVAAAVAAGRADAGMGIMAAARAFGLDFVPVTREPYDLVLDAEMLEDPVTAPLWDLLGQPGFRAAVKALGGYHTGETGRRIR